MMKYLESKITSWWDENDKIKKSSISYINGKKNGEFKSWYKNGNLESEGFYKQDLMDGDWKFYYQNGENMAKDHFQMEMDQIKIV